MTTGTGSTVGLVVHPHNPVLDSIAVITEYAHRQGASVLARESDADRVGPHVTIVGPREFVDRVDVVISLGGDGTMLGAMRLLVGRPTPVLGVNHGNLGFLAEIRPAGLPAALERLAAGQYTQEPHCCLRVAVDGGHADVALDDVAFNDVVLTADQPLTTISVDLAINDTTGLGYYRGDAVVACTPTGSTAYNYASGGPIISPSHPCVALTPIAPMSGISRTLILGDDEVTLTVPEEAPAIRCAVDGILSRPLRPPVALKLRLCPEPVNVLRLDLEAYARRRSVKLSLLDLPLRQDQLLELFPPHLREQAERLRGTGEQPGA